jgi:CheY-like chemotaxis protein
MMKQQIGVADAGHGERRMPLSGQRALVIEDEGLVCVLIEDILLDSGCEIAGTASSLSDALDKVGTLSFDFAIVDVNLNGLQSLPVAEALVERGLPFVLATGYGATGLSKSFPGVPMLQKPFLGHDLEQALCAMLKV